MDEVFVFMAFSGSFSSVYGLFVDSKRETFKEELGTIRGLWDGPWCLGGNFNLVCS